MSKSRRAVEQQQQLLYDVSLLLRQQRQQLGVYTSYGPVKMGLWRFLNKPPVYLQPVRKFDISIQDSARLLEYLYVLTNPL